jgi:Chaperone of endosialidase
LANKDFVVRNGLVVGNTFAVNASSNTVTVVGTVHADSILVSGSAIQSGSTANLVYDTSNAAFGKANGAFGVANAAYNNANVGLASANSWSNQIGLSSNSWANTVALSANGWANTVALSANGWANTVAISANSWANSVALSANGWANTVALSANSYSNTVGLSGNAYANVIGVSGNAYSNVVGISGNTYANLVGSSSNNYAGVMANSSNNYANATFLKLTGGTIGGDLSVTGNLSITGNTSYVNVTNYKVQDSLIYLADQNYSSDVVEIGFVGNYSNGACTTVHTGLFRSPSTKEYYLFQGYDKEPSGNYIDPTGNNITNAVLNADLITSNLTLGGANSIVWIKAGYDNSNGAFGVTNAAFGHSNTTYGAVNSAFGVINAAYTSVNAGYTVANSGFTVANAAFGAANNVGPQIAPAYNTANAGFGIANASYGAVNSAFGVVNSAYGLANADSTRLSAAYVVANAAFGVANNALPKAGGTMTGKPIISLDDASMAIAGSHLTINSPTLSQVSLGFSFGGVGKASLRIDNGGSYVMNSMANTYYFGYDVASGGTTTSTFYNSSSQFMYVSGSNVYIPTDVRAPIFYDKDNTGYYVDPASTSVLNYTQSYTLNINRSGSARSGISWYSSSYNSWDTYMAPPGAGMGPYGTLTAPTGTYVNSWALRNVVEPATGYGWTWENCANNGTTPSIAAELRYDGLFYSVYQWAWGDHRAPIFYDWNDTGYYIDPNSTSDSALRMRGGALFGPNTSWGAYLWVGANGRPNDNASVCATDGNLHIDCLSGHMIYLNYYSNANVYQGGSGFLYSGTSIRAPIFYDTDNTGYYIDGNNTSNLNALNVGGYRVITTQQGSRYSTDFNTLLDTGHYNAEATPSNAPGNYGQLLMLRGIDTGLQIYGGYANENLWFRGYGYGSAGGGFYPWHKLLWDGISTVTVNGLYSNIIYDSDNTGYYVDPASTTNLLYLKTYNGGSTTAFFEGGWGTYGKTIRIRTSNSDGGDGPQIWFDKSDAKYWGIGIQPYSGNQGFGFWENGSNGGWGTLQMLLAPGGALYATNNITAYWSDRRLKKDIVTLDNAVEIVKKLRGVSFAWNERGKEVFNASDERETGFIAQEVQELIPSAVRENKLGQDEDGSNYLTIDQDKIVPYLVEAIKEQQDKIDRMESLINQLLNK